ncbi:glycosyltransferase [Floridanema evergladense]|uniref:Glycosyltransferase n=1 Tax=Floridaenema evergladense BLCC-F167 TaxID=3153639 RepID=A0ABV4WIS8_9CYAN
MTVTKVLYYNWDPYFEQPMQGGGVSIYCRNLIDYLSQQTDDQINFLYSGFDYTFFRKQPYIKQVYNKRHPNTPTFSLVNSPVTAPAKFSFQEPLENIENPVLEKCFQQFLGEFGPFEIIHFHNLEGITANCLKLAKESGAKVVFSLHNYWAVCPEVNLWRMNSSPCQNYLEGRACVSCIQEVVILDLELTVRKVYHLGSLLGFDRQSLPVRLSEKIYRAFYSRIWYQLNVRSKSPLSNRLEITGKDLPQFADLYRKRRQEIVSIINRYVDVAISVSERTTSIYEQYGVNSDRLITQYIGSQAAHFQIPPNNPATYSPGQPFQLIYLGTSRKDKGFYFLLEALLSLPEEELNSLDLVIASRIIDAAELAMAVQQKGQLLSLAQSLHRFRYYPGYKYENIPTMLDGIHLGVVPPLWEDNLPQVTFELLACGVPVLCSNRGGAQEFVRHPAFIFDPAKEGDFPQKLRTIRENPHLLTEFWKEARPVKTVEQHLKELSNIYSLNFL